jgi:perosamine synthetase
VTVELSQPQPPPPPRRVPGFRYTFAPEDIDTILRRYGEILATGGFLSMARYGEEFEAAFAEYTGAAHAVSLASGTSALEAMLRCHDVAGREVIVPTNTFAATAYAVISAGATPVFADVGDDLMLDPDDCARLVGPDTAAVVTVHLGGAISGRIHQLVDLCEARGLVLLEDAAHAHGSRLGGTSPGGFGRAAAFSFFSTKVMTTGEGGMLLTGSAEVADRVRTLRDQGKVNGQNHHLGYGYNWRMTEFQAIMGLAQLARLDEFIEGRERIATIYHEALDADGRVAHVPTADGLRHNRYKFIVLLPSHTDRTALARQLSTEYGVGAAGLVYDVPCHRQPAFAHLYRGPLPVAEDVCARHYCLPVYPTMSEADAEYAVSAFLKCLDDSPQ